MANVYTTFATDQLAARTDGSERPTLPLNGGNLHFLQVTKTFVAATADPLYLARLPKGARLIPQLCSVDYEDPGAACVASIGYFTSADTPVVVDVDAFGTALDLGAAAGRKSFSEAGTIGVNFLTPVTFDADAWIVVTFTTTTTAISHKETWNLAYTLA
jgi:hypothetical protein